MDRIENGLRRTNGLYTETFFRYIMALRVKIFKAYSLKINRLIQSSREGVYFFNLIPVKNIVLELIRSV